jgi:streptomycin 6-kinase
MSNLQLSERVEELVRRWRISVEESLETQSSFLLFGTRREQPVVLKVVRWPCDEWHSGRVLAAFDGAATAHVCEYTEGAVLLERLRPGNALARLSLEGRDDEATAIMAEVMQRMKPVRESLEAFTTVENWGESFARYLSTVDEQVPRELVERGQHLYLTLCATQRERRLLHGDLQHYNVLFDSRRGWLAIDPKGVVGEMEYEMGASLRNPYERPELFASAAVIERRLRLYERVLKIDYERALGWAFAQAVLSVIWGVEDGFKVDEDNSSLMLARSLEPLLTSSS